MMGLWTSIKDVLTKSPIEEMRDQRHAEREAEKADRPSDDVPELPTDDVTVDEPVAPEPPVQAEPEYRTYTVKSGDTLSAIGVEYGVDWHDIAALNNLE